MIQKQKATITGFHGNPYYAAELGLLPLPADESTDLRRHKRRSGSATETGSRSSNRKSSSSSDKMASKQQRLLATLEDAFPTALSVDDLARYSVITCIAHCILGLFVAQL